MSSAVALGVVEKLAPIVLAALGPELEKALSSLPTGMVPVAPATAAIGVETAVAANLVKAVPAAGAAEYAKIKTQIGQSVAIYKTEHPDDDLQMQVAWIDILARASAGISAEGIVVSAIPPATIWQMVLSGVEMYLAGLGTKALIIEK